MKRTHFFLLPLALVALASFARADDQTLAAQQALKDQGFYYGQVDGQPGPETDAALRRYQIRQGLDVTGKLDQETLGSLNLGGQNPKPTVEAVASPADDSGSADSQAATPARQSTTPAGPVVQSDQDFLKHQQPDTTPAPQPQQDDSTPPAAEAQPPQPEQPQPQQPQQPPVAQPVIPAGTQPADYSRFFRKTPYETAPPVVQRSTVQRAQVRLGREGFYRGAPDGELSDHLSRALAGYQRYADLSPTGRLDMETLEDMNLLPARHVVAAPPGPFGNYPPPPAYYPPPAPDGREIYRGLWVH